MKNLVYLILLIALINPVLSQDYVKVSATSSKKDFQLSENIKINLKAVIQEGFHINANKIADEDLIPTSINFKEGDFKLIKINWPSPKSYKFAFSETELQVFEGSFNVGLNLKAKKDLKPGKYDISGSLHYQACNDRACFAPKDVEFTASINLIADSVKKTDTTSGDLNKNENKKDSTNLTIGKDTTKSQTTTTLKENKRDTTQTITSTDQNQISGYIKEKGLFLTLLLIFLGGLALNLTPCVYPLIPITISYFGAQVSGNKAQKIVMALVYILGMSVTYSVLGLVAALTGGLFGSALQNPIVVSVIVIILVALALSMFGLFEIRIPQSIANFSGKNRQGYFGTALMGLTVGFIAAPCIGPFVLSLLVYVGQLGSAFMGFLLFFVLSLGLGFPYIFLAIFSGSISKLPRSGEWMEGVKIIFGFVMIGLALYTAQTLIPPKIYEIVFPIYLIIAGFYLIVIDRKAINASGYTKIKYVIAIGSIVFGSMNLPRVLGGEQQQLGGKLEWQNLNIESQIASSIAKSSGKPTMIDFYADWCAQCKELDKYTYVDPKVVELSKKFNNIKVDLTKENKEITDKYKILGLPVVAFLDNNGKEMEQLRVTGFLKPADFSKLMEKALNN